MIHNFWKALNAKGRQKPTWTWSWEQLIENGNVEDRDTKMKIECLLGQGDENLQGFNATSIELAIKDLGQTTCADLLYTCFDTSLLIFSHVLILPFPRQREF